VTLHCLHGFLGGPHDWDEFALSMAQALPDLAVPGSLIKADLFGADWLPQTQTLAQWADAYCGSIAQADTQSSPATPRYLLGYSLGGRLALHVALQHPSLWDGVIIVGANPGLDTEEARQERRANDALWAQRLGTQPWDTLLAAWDAQPVFAGKPALMPPRLEADFSRARLAESLRRWSLGAQDPLWSALERFSVPLLWIAGAEDTGQAAICRRLQSTVPGMQLWIAPRAGHRVPWEQPQAFAARAREFILPLTQVAFLWRCRDGVGQHGQEDLQLKTTCRNSMNGAP